MVVSLLNEAISPCHEEEQDEAFFLLSFLIDRNRCRNDVSRHCADHVPPPCNPLAEDRTITFCYPIDNATVSWFAVPEYGWIKDSLPHTARNIWMGGTLPAPRTFSMAVRASTGR